jgi:outer membrane protein TolC
MYNRIVRFISAVCWIGLWWPVAGEAQVQTQPAQTSPLSAVATQHLSIREAYRLARDHYPSSRQSGLIELTKQYTLTNASRAYLPQLSFAGQATLQSEVTSLPFKIPIAGFSLPTYSKDQYKVYGEVDQVLYDGGLIANQREAARVTALISQQNLEVELYTLYDRVNQLFFGVLLLDEQLGQNDLLQQDIRNGIDKMTAMIDNGTAYRSSVYELQAQLLQAQQSRTEEQVTRKAYLDMLSLLTGTVLDSVAPLTEPPDLSIKETVTRPELLLYDFQKRNYDLQEEMAVAQLRPRFGLFFQGGYARPGLNTLSNNFAWYYIGGVKLSWNLGGMYTLHRQRLLSETGRRSLEVQKETFLLNTNIQQTQASAESIKYLALMQDDDKIVQLRDSVKAAALAQMTNGVLNAHDYLSQVIAEDQAREGLSLHHVEWLQSKYNYQTIVGH